jgi:hypothetical protein
MNRRSALASLGAVALGGFAGSEAAAAADAQLQGVPAITVEELAQALRTEGFQWKFVGRQIAFRATVLDAGATPRVRIAGLDKDRFDTARLHNVAADNRLKAGDQVQVRGLIVDQWYAVWQVWKYELKVSEA